MLSVIKMKKIFFILEFSVNECANSSIEEKKKNKKKRDFKKKTQSSCVFIF